MTEQRARPLPALSAVLIGGMLGTALRLGIDLALPHDETGLPVSTLLINTVGALALGVLVARLWPAAPDWLRAGLGVGLLGSFTTFSAIAVSVVSMTAAGEFPLALAYVAASVVLGLGAAFVGLRIGGTRTPAVDLEDQ